MISRTRFTTLLTLIALTALAPSAGAAVPKDFVGIDSQDTFQSAFDNRLTDVATNLAAQAATGIHIHRQPFYWEQIETSKGRYDFSVHDRYMLQMASKGMRVLPVLFDAPPWHTAGRDRPDKGLFSRPKSGKALGKFAAAVVNRYGPRGSFWKGQPAKYRRSSAIRAAQIWNEPNLRYYWSGKPNAKQYVAVLKGAFQGIKRARGGKGVEVVTAGIPQSTTRGAIGLKKYLTQMYKAGAKRWFDTLGLNAYARNSKDLGRKLTLMRSVMKRRRDGKAKLWITEIGWADTGNRHYLVKGARGQAREITNAIALIKKRRRSQRLRGFIYYQWRDAPTYREGLDAGTWGLHAGLLRQDGSFKRAHKAFKRAVAKL